MEVIISASWAESLWLFVLSVIIAVRCSYVVFHFGDALVAVFDDELKAVLVQFFQEGQDGTENILVSTVGVVLARALTSSCALFLTIGLLGLLRLLLC